MIPVAASKTFLIYYKLDQIDLNDQFNFKLHVLLDANKPVCFTFLISNAILILLAIHHLYRHRHKSYLNNQSIFHDYLPFFFFIA